MKKNLTVLMTAAMALTMAATAVQAADYANPPHYEGRPPVTVHGGSGQQTPAKPNTTVKPASHSEKENRLPDIGTSILNPISVIEKTLASDAILNDTPIYGSYDQTVIKANVLALLARTNLGRLTVITQRYTAYIDASTVTDAADIDLGAQLTKNSKMGALILRTNQKGAYPCTLNITISSDYYSQANVDLNRAHTYYVDSDKNVYDLGKIILDKEGNILLPLTTGGKYIIM